MIEIYSKHKCPFCYKAKRALDEKNKEYQEYFIDTNYDKKLELFDRYPEAKTVPQIFWDGNHIGGYEDLVTYMETQNV